MILAESGRGERAHKIGAFTSADEAIPNAEREFAEQAEISYKRLAQDQQVGAPARKVGASATPERA
jgi:hypothetical protein